MNSSKLSNTLHKGVCNLLDNILKNDLNISEETRGDINESKALIKQVNDEFVIMTKLDYYKLLQQTRNTEKDLLSKLDDGVYHDQ